MLDSREPAIIPLAFRSRMATGQRRGLLGGLQRLGLVRK
jgi:hypothetical protein